MLVMPASKMTVPARLISDQTQSYEVVMLHSHVLVISLWLGRPVVVMWCQLRRQVFSFVGCLLPLVSFVVA